MIFFLTTALAAPFSSAFATDAQPLASEERFRDLLERVCGRSNWSRRGDISGRLEIETARCEAEYQPDAGRMTLLDGTVDAVAERADPFDDARLTEQNAADQAVFLDLGFNPAEFGNSYTRDIAVEAIDDETGAVTRGYLGTLTVIERSIGGRWLPGSRLTLTRNASGALLELGGTWPEVDVTVELTERDEEHALEDYARALGAEPQDVVHVIPALELTMVEAAVAVRARTVTYVTWRVPAGEGSRAAAGIYFEGLTPLWSEK